MGCGFSLSDKMGGDWGLMLIVGGVEDTEISYYEAGNR